MNLSALEISKKLKGTIEGNAKVMIHSLSRIEDAEEGSISFLSHNKYLPFLEKTKASAVLISDNLELSHGVSTTLIRVQDAYAAFTQLLIGWSQDKKKKLKGIHATAIVDPSAQISPKAYIGPFVCIGEQTIVEDGAQVQSHTVIGDHVKIQKNTFISSRVSILDESEIGANCIIHDGVVVGSDGFGFAPQKDQAYLKIPQLGKVIIRDNVEIGANTTIDRATLGATIIGEGVKLDNLVQIAHNVEIGSHTVIAAQTGVAGSTKIGSRCVIGGQVGIIGHLTLGDGVQIQGQTGVIKNLADGSTVQGTPAIDYKSFYKSYAIFKSLPSMESRLSLLEKNK
ncbi:UDP-3-O-(3-hydroxymyristoyl)glucosamine N-acyltransferase [Flavobacteriaceae bacterium]|nr:UDP-3-O-(3-hydroxymyristoyl)glucosamine N-acyltransferase [Flavobacteriaceae bacterium]MDC3354325.1 UDP-3-O-(3-hydroxymyristoyl)glucosamine N-acyltransferase [Flavobacteriaceae bacterium]